MLFKMIDRQIWKGSVHNPVKVLKQLLEETFGKLVSDAWYLRCYDAIIARFRDYINTKVMLDSCYRAVEGLTREWVSVMKQSIKSNGPRFSAKRMVKEYAIFMLWLDVKQVMDFQKKFPRRSFWPQLVDTN